MNRAQRADTYGSRVRQGQDPEARAKGGQPGFPAHGGAPLDPEAQALATGAQAAATPAASPPAAAPQAAPAAAPAVVAPATLPATHAPAAAAPPAAAIASTASAPERAATPPAAAPASPAAASDASSADNAEAKKPNTHPVNAEAIGEVIVTLFEATGRPLEPDVADRLRTCVVEIGAIMTAIDEDH